MADNDTLTGQYGGAASFTVRHTLTAGSPFEVTAPDGNVALKAGQKITLKPGFHAHSGSRFTAAIDTALLNAQQGGKQWQLELYSYDYRGRVEKKWIITDGPGGEPVEPPQVTYSYEYNSQNALTKTTSQVGADSFYHFYEYDRLGQLVKVFTSTDGAKPAQADLVYAYNPVGAVDTLRYGEQAGGGFAVELPYRYNLREWLTDIAEVSSSALPFSAKYTYLANGNIQVSEYRNTGITAQPRYTYQYSYDNANRLTAADFSPPSGSTTAYDISNLTFDSNGNILSLTRKNEGGGPIDVLTYAYTAGSNRLASVTDGVATTPEDWDAEDTQFSYDGNGNVTAMLENGVPAISSIKYDHRNLPTSLVNRNGDVVSYRYNAAGQRIFKQIGSQAPEYYLMDGAQTIAIWENGAVKYWNLLANGVIGRRKANSEKLYYLKDHLGSTRAVVNSSGTVVEAHDYYPFGLQMPGRDYQTAERTKELFTGEERDSETNWDYFGKRYYDPAIGRWYVTDPLEQYSSPYVYAGNNPTGFIDPDGMYSQAIAWHFDGDGNLRADPGDNFDTLLEFFKGNEEAANTFWDAFKRTGQVNEDGTLVPDASLNSETVGKIIYDAGLVDINFIKDIMVVVLSLAIVPKPPTGGSFWTKLWGGVKRLFGKKSYSDKTFKAFQKQLQQHGKKSLLKSQKKILRRLKEHLQNLEEIKKAGGHSSSVEREIRTFKSQLEAISNLLN